ncbi:uncharacterized protein LOC144442824 [Glandiceps talaboti]
MKALVVHTKGKNEMQPEMVTKARELVEKELTKLIKNYTPGLSYTTSLKCTCSKHNPGELLSGCEDVDDNCIAIDTSDSGTTKEGYVICSESDLPHEEPDLQKWYCTSTFQQTEEEVGPRDTPEELIDPLTELYQELNGHIVKDKESILRNLSADKIPPRDMENLKSPFQIFKALEQRDIIGKENLQFLRTLLDKMGMQILLKLVDKCEQKLAQHKP